MTIAATERADSAHVHASSVSVRVDRALELAAAFLVITSVLGLAAALVGVFHAPQVLLGSLLLTCLYGHRTRERQAWPGRPAQWRHVALLLLVALFFRVPAYHYVMGGQDEGLYVNIAHHINYTGGIKVRDTLKQQLQNTPFLQLYASENHAVSNGYLAGVYSRNPSNSKLEFQFYDQFPIWMALFDGLFGQTFGVYALTLFALLSVVFFYRLVLLLTHSYSAALMAGGLLALNPLHVFFSKFPVTEVPTLCFSLIGFTLLAALWSSPHLQHNKRWWVLSVLAFFCVFTTRISGFMYVPFFIGIAIVSLLGDADPVRRAWVQRWAVGGIAVYAISVLYGLIWSHSYSHDIYSSSFEPLLGVHWKALVLLIAAVAAIFWCAAAWLARSRDLRARLWRVLAVPLEWTPIFAIFVALALGIIRIYQLGWTKRYNDDPALGGLWGLAGSTWTGASASSLWALIVYLGPLLVLAFLMLVPKRRLEPRLVFLRWFVAGFWGYALLLQWVVPYGPYYARYLLSELLPYLLLFVVCVWSGLRQGFARAGISLMLSFSIVYAGILSAGQIGKSENDGAYAALARLTAPVDPGDLILLKAAGDATINESEIKTPLLYTFHREVATLGDSDLHNLPYLAELNSLYDDVYLLSTDSSAPNDFDLVDSLRFSVMAFRPSHGYPHKLVLGRDVVLYLYRLDRRPPVPLATPISFAAGQWSDLLQNGWNPPEPWGVWSSGNNAVLGLNTRGMPDNGKGLVLTLQVKGFVTAAHPLQRIGVSLDGEPTVNYSIAYPASNLTMQIPVDRKYLVNGKQLQVEFSLPDAISPQALHMSDDARPIAIGLLSANINAMQDSTSQDAAPPAAKSNKQDHARP